MCKEKKKKIIHEQSAVLIISFGMISSILGSFSVLFCAETRKNAKSIFFFACVLVEAAVLYAISQRETKMFLYRTISKIMIKVPGTNSLAGTAQHDAAQRSAKCIHNFLM